jgi:prepilin-type N-terminal cleavage/methylation domain-containing protein
MRARNRRAFTLVELMTVVAIIALLISILLPALGRAREMGRRTVCLANIRSMAQGCISYAAGSDGHFPVWNQTISGYAGIGAEWGWDGLSTPVPAIASPISNTRNLWILVRNQAGDPKTFICPSDGEAGEAFTPGDMTGIYDVQNRSQFSYSFQYQGPAQIVNNAAIDGLRTGWNTTLKDDSRLVILADATPAMKAIDPRIIGQDSANHAFNILVANDVTLQPFRDALQRLAAAALPNGINYNAGTAKGEYRLPDGGILPAVNSANHRGEGQNIVRLDGSGEFAANPWAGAFMDNIYTVQDPSFYDAAHLADNASQAQKTELLKARMLGKYEGGPGTYTEVGVMQDWVVNNVSKTRFPDSFLVP